MHDDSLRAILETLDPNARDALRRVLIHDQDDRDAVSSQLLRYRDGHGDGCADIIDMLTMHPEERRRASCGWEGLTLDSPWQEWWVTSCHA
jgi:hypothetical protein